VIYIILLFIFIALLAIGYIFWEERQRRVWLKKIFQTEDYDLINKKKSKRVEEFDTKLLQAGLSYKDIKEILLVAILCSASLTFLAIFMNFSTLTSAILIVISAILPIAVPFLLIDEQAKKRKKKIEEDLSIFLDLVVIILEGGGGLNNAIDEVANIGSSVIGKDLLDEIKIFKSELISYGNEVAYENLVKRTNSEVLATLVGFMKLSEETGVGVKSVFENQASEIKEKEILSVEKKAATMNINMTFTMFLFILPAVIAMIAFPMSSIKILP
jgi:tight adherence protein C